MVSAAKMAFLSGAIFCAYLVVLASGQTTILPSSTVSGDPCHKWNSSCGDCVGFAHAQCLWCPTAEHTCQQYPAGSVFPNGVCALTDARWLNCWVNFQVLLIIMGVLAGVIIIALVTCVYCCCCRTNSSRLRRRAERDEARAELERTERQTRSAERNAERQSRYDEIRRKYGLSGNGGGGGPQYAKFENEAEA